MPWTKYSRLRKPRNCWIIPTRVRLDGVEALVVGGADLDGDPEGEAVYVRWGSHPGKFALLPSLFPSFEVWRDPELDRETADWIISRMDFWKNSSVRQDWEHRFRSEIERLAPDSPSDPSDHESF